MFLEGLDELDQKIIQILIGNARISYSEIGEKIGISRVAVKATIINPQKISGAVSCYFEIETQPDTFLQAVEILNENETITQIYRVTGKNRLHVHAVASSNEEMEALIQQVIDPLPGLLSCSCNIILSRIKDIKGLRL